MNLRDLARVILVGRESARRVGCSFEMRAPERIGISPFDLDKVLRVVKEIETYTDTKLRSLDR